MNREAVALGTPVFTTFEGRLGAVDEELLRDGRLRKLEDAGQVQAREAPGAGVRPHPPRSSRIGETAALGHRTVRTRLTSSVNVRRVGQVGVDACLIALAYYLAFVLRFDAGIPGRYEDLLAETVAFVVPLKLVIFAAFGLYSKLWRFVDQADFESIVKAVVVSSFVLIGLLFLLTPTDADPPRGVIALDFLLTLALVAGARFLVRAAVERPLRQPLVQRAEHRGADRGRRQRRPAGGAASCGATPSSPAP